MLAKRLSEEPTVDASASVVDSALGAYTDVGARAVILESAIADYSYVIHDSQVAYADIGKFCSIASFTRINPGNHPTWRASQHHFLYRSAQYGLGEDEEAIFDWRRDHGVSIGHDVWIGHGAVVLPGRTIGTGSVIGAGSVVSRDVTPYTIVAGVPARVIRRRFEAAIADRMMDLAWWDWPRDRLKAALPDFRALSAEAFLEQYGGG